MLFIGWKFICNPFIKFTLVGVRDGYYTLQVIFILVLKFQICRQHLIEIGQNGENLRKLSISFFQIVIDYSN